MLLSIFISNEEIKAMSSTVTNYIQPLTQPLEGLYNSFTQMASQHRDMNNSLRSHKDDLLSNAAFTFQGLSADAFASLVDSYLDTSEKHMQAFDDASGAVRTCHSTITTASSTADSAGLHQGLTTQILSQVSHNDIIQRGSDPIQAVINDMQRTLNDMTGKTGDMFNSLLHFQFGTAFDDWLQEQADTARLIGDIGSLLQDIARVLGHWAETVWSAVKSCLSAIGITASKVLDFLKNESQIAWSLIQKGAPVAWTFIKDQWYNSALTIGSFALANGGGVTINPLSINKGGISASIMANLAKWTLWQTSGPDGHAAATLSLLSVKAGGQIGNPFSKTSGSQSNKSPMLFGLSGEVDTAKLDLAGTLGNKNLGVTGDANVMGPSANAQLGVNSQGNFDAKAGISLVQASGSVGANVDGVNVGVTGTIGLKAEVGLQLGPDPEVELPFVSFGLNIGQAH
jgi:hypothetical protein